MVRITLDIERMACKMCEAHINEAVSVDRESYEKKGILSAFRR